MNKKVKKHLKIWIPIGVVLLLIIISLAIVLGSSTRVAFLNIEEGNVEVDTGAGWMAAQDGMSLSLQDKVRTLEGKAVIILYESILVQLDEETEISIEELSKENVKINQNSGSTWNKFTAIAGIQNFEVETPTTVATVRGTEFWVDMETVGVAEGDVDVKVEGKLMKLAAGKKALLRQKIIEDLTEQDFERTLMKKEIVLKHLKRIRQDEINKHKTVYKLVKKVKKWTDADVQRNIDKMDDGKFDENDLRKRTVLPAKSIDKFAKITTEIKEQKKQVEEFRQKRELLRAKAGVMKEELAVEKEALRPRVIEQVRKRQIKR